MAARTISLDTDLVRVLQSKRGDRTWNEYLSDLLGYDSFKEFKKHNATNVVDENQLEIDYEQI